MVAGATALALVIYLAWHEGGFFAPYYLRAGAVACLVVAILLVAAPPRQLLSGESLVALGGLGGLVLLTALSTRWSPAPDAGVAALQRSAVYLALFGLALLAAGSGRYVRHLVWAALGAALVIVGAGLLSRLYPDLVHAPPPTGLAGYRLSYPLGYWNVYGALAGMAGVLAVGAAADPAASRPLRALAAAVAVPLAVAVYLSLSRGAWLAVFAGLVVLLVLGAHRASLLISAAIVAGAAVIAIIALRHYPALTKNPRAGSGQEEQGHAFAGTLLLVTILAGCVQGALVAWRPSRELRTAVRGVLRPVALVVAGVAAVAAIGVYAVKSSAVEGIAAKGLDRGTSWVDRQWQDFLRPTTFSQGGTSRLTTARGTRSDLYRIALDGFLAHPLGGDGGGGYQVRYVRMRRVDEYVVNAHSLELETLDELGLAGAALLLLFVGALIFAGVRARVRPGGLSRPRAAAVTAALAVWVVHSAVDWDWQMPAVTGLALLLGAALLPYGRGRRRASQEPVRETWEPPPAHGERTASVNR